MALLNIDVPAGWTVVAGKAQVRKVIGAAGNEVAARARAIIRSGDRKHASEPGQPPHSVSGKLARSIRSRTRKDGEGATIRASEFYALFLSLGARGGGGNTHDKANILLAGERKWVRGRWKVLREVNRTKRSAISRNRVLLARPFLGPALDQVIANGLADRVRAAITSGLKFERGKK
jgi:hypothetical protein